MVTCGDGGVGVTKRAAQFVWISGYFTPPGLHIWVRGMSDGSRMPDIIEGDCWARDLGRSPWRGSPGAAQGGGGADGGQPGRAGAGETGKAQAKLIGDGSTADTGKQPNQPGKPVPLEPGETPPQFVIFSWDGAGEVGNGLFPRFLDLARNHGAGMTFFLSGLYLLPESKKSLYRPPNNPVGASDIGYLTDAAPQGDAEVHPAGLAGRSRDRHALQRPLLRRPRDRSRAGRPPSGTARSTRRSPSSPNGAPTPAGTTRTRCRSTTTRSSSAAVRPVCSARTTCCPRPRNGAGATTPPLPADARSGRTSAMAYGTFRCRASRSPGTPSRSCPWTTTSSPTSRRTAPRA